MRKERLYYIENLRTVLTVLVILQHAVRAYGSAVWWFVDDGKAPLLDRFTAVNSSFFMSLFFVISFYFLPASFDGKTFRQFHRDRFLRLCVPLVVYVTLVAPTMMYLFFLKFRPYGQISFFVYYRDYFLGMTEKPALWSGPSWPDLNFGHLWFVEHLILYGIAYSLFRRIVKNKAPKRAPERTFPSTAALGVFAFLLGLAAFAVRIRWPLYTWIGFLGFIQMEAGHVPFYLAMFFAGLAAYRNDWLNSMPGRTGKTALTAGIVAAVLIFLMPPDGRYYGGLSARSLLYALTESFACIGLTIGLLYAFWKRFNSQSALMKTLSRVSYMVYIIHLPVVVFFQYLALSTEIDPYLKFGLVSAVSIPISFVAALLLKRIPYARKYL